MPVEPLAASAGPEPAPTVTRAIRRASDATGAAFDYLMRTAARESSFDPAAKASTSTATGLFQFIEETWLAAVERYGEKHGLGHYAEDIVRDETGRPRALDPARRSEIMALREDPVASAALAGEIAKENGAYLSRKLGRAARSVDLYAAHFLGPAGAAKLLSAAASSKAADIVPAAANANRAVFYDGARARSVGEVVANLAASMGEAAHAASAATETRAPDPASALGAQTRAPSRAAFAGRGAPLSALAISVLQALDPTGLRRDEGER